MRWVLAALVLGLAPAAAAQGRTALGGGVYLFHYQPLDLAGIEPYTEVYAAFATVERRSDPWTLHAQVRARDSKLRPYYPGTVWLQEAWVAYQATGAFAPVSLRLRAGKLYQVLGRHWDGSFFGNLHYFDGLKLNPQFGIEASGMIEVGPGSIGYTAQVLPSSDGISGALAGRDFETLDGARNQDTFGGRVAFSFLFGVTVAASYLNRGVDSGGAAYRVPHVAVDAEFGLPGGPVLAYVEWSERGRGDLIPALRLSDAGSRANYWLAGLQLRYRRLQLRYNYSHARYHDLDRSEWIHQPGVAIDLHRSVQGIVELDVWRARDAGGRFTADQSVSVVLLLSF